MRDDETERRAEQIRDGDVEALGSLLAHYRRQVVRVAVFRLDARLRDRLGTLDVAGEVERRARDRLAEFQSAANVLFFVWLRALTLERIAEIHREQLESLANDELLVTTPAKLAEFVTHTLLPVYVPKRDEAIAELKATFARLTRLERELVALRMFEAWDEVETNAILGIRPDQANTHYQRALKTYRIAAAITEKYWSPSDDD